MFLVKSVLICPHDQLRKLLALLPAFLFIAAGKAKMIGHAFEKLLALLALPLFKLGRSPANTGRQAVGDIGRSAAGCPLQPLPTAPGYLPLAIG